MIASPTGQTMTRQGADALVAFIADRNEHRWRDWQKATHLFVAPAQYRVVALNVHTRQQQVFGSQEEFEAAHQALRKAARR
jgi:hypothetical protein